MPFRSQPMPFAQALHAVSEWCMVWLDAEVHAVFACGVVWCDGKTQLSGRAGVAALFAEKIPELRILETKFGQVPLGELLEVSESEEQTAITGGVVTHDKGVRAKLFVKPQVEFAFARTAVAIPRSAATPRSIRA